MVTLMKRWNGAEWVDASPRRWTGTEWQPIQVDPPAPTPLARHTDASSPAAEADDH